MNYRIQQRIIELKQCINRKGDKRLVTRTKGYRFNMKYDINQL